MNNELLVRPARPDDRAAVLAFREDDDYIHLVWEDWLVAADGPFLVATRDQQPIGIIKFSDLGEGEAWVQGVRVAKALRGQGIGRQLLKQCVQLAEQEGYRSLRLMTSTENRAMQRTAEALGFRVATTGAWFSTPVAHTAWPLITLPEDQFERLYHQRTAAPNSRLCCIGWRYRDLTAQRLRQHLRNGEVVALPGTQAWAIAVPDDQLWLGYAHGQADDLIQLLRSIPAHPQGALRVRVLTPTDGQLGQALLAAGYCNDEYAEYCYEMHLHQ